MTIQLRLKNETFDKVCSGELSTIRHGYSKNKKYQRLFKDIDNVQLFNEDRSKSCFRKFGTIDITEENNKLIFKLELYDPGIYW